MPCGCMYHRLPRWRSRKESTWQEMQETQVWSQVWEGPLEQEMATHSGILVSWTEEDWWTLVDRSMVSQRVGHD